MSPKLLRVCKATQRRHRVLKGLPGRGWRLTDLTSRDLGILLLDRPHDVGRVEVPHRELLGVEPDPHAVVALAEERNITDTWQPRQFIVRS